LPEALCVARGFCVPAALGPASRLCLSDKEWKEPKVQARQPGCLQDAASALVKKDE